MSESNKKLKTNHVDDNDVSHDDFKNSLVDSSLRSFNDTDWGSLDDKELVAAINKLSQENKKLSQQEKKDGKKDDNRGVIIPVHSPNTQDEMLSSLPVLTLPDESDGSEDESEKANNNQILSIGPSEKVKRNLIDSFRDSSFIEWDSFDDEEALMVLDENGKKNQVSEIIKKSNCTSTANELETVSSILKKNKKTVNNFNTKNEIKISELSKLSNINRVPNHHHIDHDKINDINSEIEDILDDDNEELNKLILKKDNKNTTLDSISVTMLDNPTTVNICKPNTKDHESIEDRDDKLPISNVKHLETMDVDEDESEEDESEEEDEEGKWGFGDYDSYFHNKRTKQQLADDEYINFINQKNPNLKFPKIFENCIIYVNGKTNPDISQLHKMIILHGGKFLHYLQSKGSVTHIIASNLTPRKKIEFKNYKVVKPDWIVESVAKGKLLHWFDYLLINNDYGQKKLVYRPQSDISERIEDKNDQNDQNDQNEGEELYTDKLETNNEKLPIDAKDPNFLKFFFEKSRLHHLSNWKSELRADFLSKAIEILKKRENKIGNPIVETRKIPSKSRRRIIMHIDFDCFFATVSALTHTPPIDINKYPVCVTHGGSNADIASCNYIARSKGVSNGMWFGKAIKLCPGLIKLDYQFEEYEKRSKEFYRILLEYEVNSILPISIDEALVDITDIYEKIIDNDDGDEGFYRFIETIREKIRLRTNGCIVSCGISTNVLLAKLSLRHAKPNGIFILNESYDEVDNQVLFKFLDDIEFKKLPGIGSSINSRLLSELNLQQINLKQVRELMSKEKLIKLFGIKTGEMIFNYCRGIDHTKIDILENPTEYLRKSVNVDVNWGIRFDNKLQVETFLTSMAKELNQRLHKIQSTGSQITLKLAKRHPDAPIEPAKYLGMGQCEFVSKSTRLGINTREIGIISVELKTIWRTLNIEPRELRGVSVSMTKLVNDEYKILEDTNQMKLPFKNISKGELKSDDKKIDKDAKINKDPSISTRTKLVYKSMKENLKRDFDKMKDEQNDILTSFKKSKKENSNKNDVSDTITDAIDWEVFNELPLDIQKELKSELAKRSMIGDTPITTSIESTPKKDRLAKLRVTPRKNKSKSPEQATKLYHFTKSPIKLTNPSTNLNLDIDNGTRSHTSTPFASPIRANHGITKPQYIDKDVFEQLPFEIQEDIMREFNMDHRQSHSVQAVQGEDVQDKHSAAAGSGRSTGHSVSGVSRSKKTVLLVNEQNNKLIINEEWVNNKMSKYNEFFNNGGNKQAVIKSRFFNLKFQDSFKIEKIYELVDNWIEFSYLSGPNELDFKLFKKYLIDLIDFHDFIRFLNILDYIHQKLKFMNKYYFSDGGSVDKSGIIEWFQLYDELNELKESINLSKLKFKF
ncbi:transferase activity protein [[Candida] boidinii]|nr:transferase activity protein [[Candida] boidinii]OWB82706.1 transferase activity protein [[Candida] boidinii]